MPAMQHPIGPSGLAAKVRELIEELMNEQNLSAKRLGKMAGVDDTAIGRILKGQMVPSVDVVDRIFAGLGCIVEIEITPDVHLQSKAIIKGVRR